MTNVNFIREGYLIDHDPVRAYVTSVGYLIHCYRDFLRPHIKNEDLRDGLDDVVKHIEELKKEIEITAKNKE